MQDWQLCYSGSCLSPPYRWWNWYNIWYFSNWYRLKQHEEEWHMLKAIRLTLWLYGRVVNSCIVTCLLEIWRRKYVQRRKIRDFEEDLHEICFLTIYWWWTNIYAEEIPDRIQQSHCVAIPYCTWRKELLQPFNSRFTYKIGNIRTTLQTGLSDGNVLVMSPFEGVPLKEPWKVSSTNWSVNLVN